MIAYIVAIKFDDDYAPVETIETKTFLLTTWFEVVPHCFVALIVTECLIRLIVVLVLAIGGTRLRDSQYDSQLAALSQPFVA